MFSCPPVKQAKDRILDLFDQRTFENLYPISKEVSEIKISGLISHPNFSRKSNRYLFVFVNGRPVQDRLLNHAIVSGYRSLLMTQQYPMVLLKLEINPSLVDVNVHPTKREVRFSNGNSIHNLVSQSISQTLGEAPWNQTRYSKPKASGPGKLSDLIPSPLGREGQGEGENREPSPQDESHQYRHRVKEALASYATRKEQPLTQSYQKDLFNFSSDPALTPQAKIGTLSFSSLKLIGQFQATYLVCEHEGSLILIDQHAAHERIGFEKLKASSESKNFSQQNLLEPITFSLRPAEGTRLNEALGIFSEFGLNIEAFGENTFVIKSHPTLLKDCDWPTLIQDLLDQMKPEDQKGPLQDRFDHILATMACHRQIRANHPLAREEMEALLEQLEGTPRSYHCPHGRPVMVEITAREIEKWFKRIL